MAEPDVPEAERRRKSEWKVNLGIRNSSRSTAAVRANDSKKL